MSNKATSLRDMQEQRPVAVTQQVKPVPAGSPRYRVEERSYIGGRMVEPGEEIEYAGRPGRFLTHVGGPEWTDPNAKGDTKAKPV